MLTAWAKLVSDMIIAAAFQTQLPEIAFVLLKIGLMHGLLACTVGLMVDLSQCPEHRAWVTPECCFAMVISWVATFSSWSFATVLHPKWMLWASSCPVSALTLSPSIASGLSFKNLVPLGAFDVFKKLTRKDAKLFMTQVFS